MNQVGYKSDKGRYREINEDSYAVLPDQSVFLVADGVGGSNAGDVASRTAISEIVQYLDVHPIDKNKDEISLRVFMKRCAADANDTVYALGKKTPNLDGLATTLIMCHILDGKASFVNVGDSRGYLFRQGELTQITEDHSYVNSLVKLGVLKESQAEIHVKGNVITRAIGAEREVASDFYTIDVGEGDIILLCTDGLYNEVSEEEMENLMSGMHDMQQLAEELVNLANQNGGRDNITVIAVKIVGGKYNE